MLMGRRMYIGSTLKRGKLKWITQGLFWEDEFLNKDVNNLTRYQVATPFVSDLGNKITFVASKVDQQGREQGGFRIFQSTIDRGQVTTRKVTQLTGQTWNYIAPAPSQVLYGVTRDGRDVYF